MSDFIPTWLANLEDQGDQEHRDLAKALLAISKSPRKRKRTLETETSFELPDIISRLVTDSATLTNDLSAAESPTMTLDEPDDLNFTIPAIYFGPPSLEYAQVISSAEAGIPSKVSALLSRFSEGAADPALPVDIILRIRSISPGERFPHRKTPKTHHAYTTTQFFEHVSVLFNKAWQLYAENADESNWNCLARLVLEDPLTTGKSCQFVIPDYGTSRMVCSDLLPKKNNKAISSSVKVSQLLQFNRMHPLIYPLYLPVFQKQPSSFSLSAFNDIMAMRTFTCALIDVKAPIGNFREASCQIGIASAAMLQKLRLLDHDTRDVGDCLPVVGWVVHGHSWSLHITYREASGSIRVLGPYPSGSTATFLGIYRLLRIVEEVKRWGERTYFPYLKPMLVHWQ